jgi:hypothetical protein
MWTGAIREDTESQSYRKQSLVDVYKALQGANGEILNVPVTIAQAKLAVSKTMLKATIYLQPSFGKVEDGEGKGLGPELHLVE